VFKGDLFRTYEEGVLAELGKEKVGMMFSM